MDVTAPPPGAANTHIFFEPPVPRRKKKVPKEWNILVGTLQRSPSFSDNTSVTSEESFTLSTTGMLVAQLSKSPSAEFITEATEEHKAQMFMQESVFVHLSIEEEECILNVPAAKHLDDLQMFVRLFPYFNGNHHIEEIMYLKI